MVMSLFFMDYPPNREAVFPVFTCQRAIAPMRPISLNRSGGHIKALALPPLRPACLIVNDFPISSHDTSRETHKQLDTEPFLCCISNNPLFLLGAR